MFLRETTLSLTSTITKRNVLHIVLTVLLAPVAVAQGASLNQAGQPTLQREVRQLGLPGNDDFADVKKLARTPAASTGFLISQLRVLEHPERTIVGEGNPQVEHVLWSIRALRYITGGMDFCAPTKWRFGESGEEAYRSYWLHFGDNSCVTFFAVWPSRGRCYVAPQDAQRKVISAWERWYASESKNYDYRPLVNPKSWQWLEGVQKLRRVGDGNKHEVHVGSQLSRN